MTNRNHQKKLTPLTVILWLSLLSFQCSIDRTISLLNPTEYERLKDFENLSAQNRLQIGDETEPGQKLWLCLTLISKEGKQPLMDEQVHLYHTSSAGAYNPADPNDESTARLNGRVRTNKKGQAFICTILPGDYGSSADNRHIHTTVQSARPQAYDIHFKQYTGAMGVNFISGSDQHFLADLKQTEDSILVAFLTIEVKNISSPTASTPDCRWCGANEAPANVTWEATIADENEEGDRLILEGTIYEPDGKTPAENVIVYAYHTNHDGLYEKRGNETGNGVRHGYLRSWAKTNKEGKYRFYTVKPAPYPNHTEPAHVHMTLKGEHFDEYWINATWFEGDTIITPEMVEKLDRTGGFSNIIELQQEENGPWIGLRDIILNPPNE